MIDARLLGALRDELRDIGERAPWRLGVVTAVASAPPSVSVSVGGGAAIDGIRYLLSYAPAVGHTVIVLERSGDRVVIGRLA